MHPSVADDLVSVAELLAVGILAASPPLTISFSPLKVQVDPHLKVMLAMSLSDNF